MTAYFKEFRKISYGDHDVRDITQRVAFFEQIRDDDFRSSDYIVQDGETPEMLAQDFYGNPELDWTIISINKIIDPFYDWVMDTNTFEQYLRMNYLEPDAVKEYRIPDGRTFPADVTQGLTDSGFASVAFPITFRAYEENLNEKKRNIRIIRPENMSKVLEQFTSLMRGIR
jgi:hypothetical protein